MRKKNKSFYDPYDMPSIKYYDFFSLTKKVGKFEKNIEKEIVRLEKKGIDIDLCAEYLQNLANKQLAAPYGELEKKHCFNKNSIQKEFTERESQKKEIQNMIKRIDDEINDTKAELELVKKIFEEYNPLYNGQLHKEERD